MVDRVDQIQHELIREALCVTGIHEGIEVTTMAVIPSEGSGLGSSSSVTVGSLHALHAYSGEMVSAEKLAKEACDIEIAKLKKPIGIQDQYIAAYGNLRFLEFLPDGQVKVEKLGVDDDFRRALKDCFLLFFTGIHRRADTILAEQKDNIKDRIAGYLATNDAGDLAVVSAPREELPPRLPRLGAVTLRPRGAPARTVVEPPAVVARMLGETLSVLLDAEHDVVFATHPLGDCVTVWRLSDGAWLETIELQNPRGVALTLDGQLVLVSHARGNSVSLSAFARGSRERLAFDVEPSFVTGSHLYVCPL